MTTKLVSSDLNGTLVHQHTMSDMIRLYIGQEQFEKANSVFKKQTAGTASMEEAFENAGPLTKGLTLRQAIEYTQHHMKFVDGWHEFKETLHEKGIPFVINSTGYSVTISAIKYQHGFDGVGFKKIHGSIGNQLIFGEDGDSQSALQDDELDHLVYNFIHNRHPENRESFDEEAYDRIKAVGKVELGLVNEDAKAELLEKYAAEHFPDIQPEEMLHMGDTMGDSGGIYGTANFGGVGVAFNYNGALEQFLQAKIAAQPELAERTHFIDPKSKTSDLRNVLQVI